MTAAARDRAGVRARASVETADAAPDRTFRAAGRAPGAPLRHSVLLVRHASTAWTGQRWCGRADPPLNATGRREAAALARALAPALGGGPAAPAAAVRTSPARRAISTAAAIAAAAGIDLESDPDLVEVDLGDAEGLTWPELETRYPAIAQRILARQPVDWPAGEPHESLRARASRAAARVADLATTRPVLVVSHGYVLELVAGFLDATADPLAAPLAPAAVRRMPEIS